MTPRQKAVSAARERIEFLKSQGADITVRNCIQGVEIEHRRPSFKKGHVARSFEIITIPSE
jgi:hypothetical protein